MFFEDDPEMLELLYECQDGTAMFSSKGFFNTPLEESKWPRCIEGDIRLQDICEWNVY
jgi:hypothetical protein